MNIIIQTAIPTANTDIVITAKFLLWAKFLKTLLK